MKLLVAGDFVPQNRIKKKVIGMDMAFIKDEVKSLCEASTYALVNLEAPIVLSDKIKPITKTGPNLRAPLETIYAVKEAGFNCVTLANNHFRDYGQEGIKSTIKVCKEFDVDYVGGGIDLTESRKILYKEINGICLAIINICEHEWSIATDEYGGANPQNPIRQFYEIKEAREKAQYVAVLVHGGIEWYNLPTPRMKETYRFYIDAGADTVINHHQHCYSGYEIYKGKPIFYGLGNFCFDNGRETRTFWNEGYMVLLDIDKSDVKFQLIPYVQCAEEPNINLMQDRTDFDTKIMKINAIITNDSLLEEKFHELALTRERAIKSIMTPYGYNILQKLCAKKLIPSFISREKIMQLLAHSQCESHRDLIIEYLKSAIK